LTALQGDLRADLERQKRVADDGEQGPGATRIDGGCGVPGQGRPGQVEKAGAHDGDRQEAGDHLGKQPLCLGGAIGRRLPEQGHGVRRRRDQRREGERASSLLGDHDQVEDGPGGPSVVVACEHAEQAEAAHLGAQVGDHREVAVEGRAACRQTRSGGEELPGGRPEEELLR
jgi:hypothetical protein